MEENVVQTLYGLVKALRVPVTRTTIIKEVGDHPHKKTLFGISEILTKWRITNAAYSLPAEKLQSDYTPFIAYMTIGVKEYGFTLVKKIDDNSVTVSNENLSDRIITRGQFNKTYNGAVLLVEPEESAGEANYKVNRRAEIVNSLKIPLLSVFFVFLFSGFFIRGGTLSSATGISLALKIAGFLISGLLVTRELNAGSALANAFCFKGKTTDCDGLLATSASKPFLGLSWAQIGMIYFASSALIVLVAHTAPGVTALLSVLSTLSVPFIVYSLSYQAFIARKWCIMCCAVQLILLSDFLVLLPFFADPLGNLNFVSVYTVLLCITAPVTVWAILKPLIARSLELKAAQRTLQKFKQDDALFKKVLSEQPNYQLPEEDYAIVIGSRSARNIITMVSNPYCGPCAVAHKALNDWLAVTDDVQVRIILTPSAPDAVAARHFIALNNKSADRDFMAKAIHEWYDQQKKDYPKWAKKYPADLSAGHCDQMMFKQSEWCRQANVQFTPLVIVNGHQMPGNYAIEDLRYLI